MTDIDAQLSAAHDDYLRCDVPDGPAGAAQTDLLTLEVLRLRQFKDKVLQWISNGYQGGNGESFYSNLNDLCDLLDSPKLPLPEYSGCCSSNVDEGGRCTCCREVVWIIEGPK